jgi:predicted nuclease with TOPRIM domain
MTTKELSEKFDKFMEKIDNHLQQDARWKGTIDSRLEVVQEKITSIENTTSRLDEKLDSLDKQKADKKELEEFATKQRVIMVERVVYGAVSLILTSFGLALVALIIKP